MRSQSIGRIHIRLRSKFEFLEHPHYGAFGPRCYPIKILGHFGPHKRRERILLANFRKAFPASATLRTVIPRRVRALAELATSL